MTFCEHFRIWGLGFRGFKFGVVYYQRSAFADRCLAPRPKFYQVCPDPRNLSLTTPVRGIGMPSITQNSSKGSSKCSKLWKPPLKTGEGLWRKKLKRLRLLLPLKPLQPLQALQPPQLMMHPTFLLMPRRCHLGDGIQKTSKEELSHGAILPVPYCLSLWNAKP